MAKPWRNIHCRVETYKTENPHVLLAITMQKSVDSRERVYIGLHSYS